MRPFLQNVLAAALAVILSGAAGRASAQDVPAPPTTGEVWAVAFVDVDPPQAAAALGALRRYRSASLAETGALTIGLFQEQARPSRMVVVETWHDQAGFDTHTAGGAAGALKAALQPAALGVTDLRVHRVLPLGSPTEDGAAKAGPVDGAVLVMTHLDVPPPYFAALQPPLKAYAGLPQAGRTSLEVLQHVPPRQNHLTILEGWTSAADLEASRRTAGSRDFRDTTVPMLGALYDERIYTRLE